MNESKIYSVLLEPNEKFAIEVFRKDGGIDEVVNLTNKSKNTINSWIYNETEPSRSMRPMVERAVPKMKPDLWRKQTNELLDVSELLYLFSIRERINDYRCADKVGISKPIVSRILNGYKGFDSAVADKIVNKLSGVLGVKRQETLQG